MSRYDDPPERLRPEDVLDPAELGEYRQRRAARARAKVSRQLRETQERQQRRRRATDTIPTGDYDDVREGR